MSESSESIEAVSHCVLLIGVFEGSIFSGSNIVLLPPALSVKTEIFGGGTNFGGGGTYQSLEKSTTTVFFTEVEEESFS
jgi:hypothetical protein